MTSTKCCTKCKEEKPLEAYSCDRQKRDRLSSHCRPCHQADNRRHYAGNRAAYYRKTRAWAKANPEKTGAWAKANPEKHRAIDATRRARKVAALDPTANPAAIAAIHADALLASQFTGGPFAVDHIVPLARGGKHHDDNLRILPTRLNSVKGAKLDSEVTDPDFLAFIHPSPTFERVIPRGCLPCVLAIQSRN